MEEDWTGKAVSIECDAKLGVFQGIISQCTPSEITIVRAFRNGVPLRKQDAEVTLRSTDIVKISLIPSYNGQSSMTPTVINKPTPVKQPNFASAATLVQRAPVEQQQLQNECSDINSTLSSKLTKMSINSNGNQENSATKNISRASSAQQALYGSSSKSTPPPQQQQTSSTLTSSSVAKFFGNLIPHKVEVRLGSTSGLSGACCSASICSTSNSCNAESCSSSGAACSKPIDIVQNRGTYYNNNNNQSNGASYSSGNGGGGGGHGNNRSQRSGNNGYANNNGNGVSNGGNVGRSKQRNKQLRRENSVKHNQTFGTSVDDPLLHEDFDFEGNLALFDKQAIWDSLEAGKKPDVVQHAVSAQQQKKYRHDENVIVSEPAEMRQIESLFEGSEDFVTDEGLIIPTIPAFVRMKIEICAQKCGLSMQRQLDMLARGATDLAILLLGGARRLNPNNRHQWPTVAIICEKSDHFRSSNVGASTGRQLASHGLKVLLYLEEDPNIEQKSIEISLFKATGNTVVYSANALPTPDLVILSTNTTNLSNDVKKWLSENRASVLAIDPPPTGIPDVSIKYAILPILPLNGISSNNCGKLYLCNLGIPDKYYRDAGIKYKSPFGHKFVIPIHSKN